MLVSLMRAMKPKILESFKDYNAQKEFLAKLSTNKNIIVVLKNQNNLIKNPQMENTNNYLKTTQKVIVYNFYHTKLNLT